MERQTSNSASSSSGKSPNLGEASGFDHPVPAFTPDREKDRKEGKSSFFKGRLNTLFKRSDGTFFPLFVARRAHVPCAGCSYGTTDAYLAYF
jgi:hypothetical protein